MLLRAARAAATRFCAAQTGRKKQDGSWARSLLPCSHFRMLQEKDSFPGESSTSRSGCFTWQTAGSCSSECCSPRASLGCRAALQQPCPATLPQTRLSAVPVLPQFSSHFSLEKAGRFGSLGSWLAGSYSWLSPVHLHALINPRCVPSSYLRALQTAQAAAGRGRSRLHVTPLLQPRRGLDGPRPGKVRCSLIKQLLTWVRSQQAAGGKKKKKTTTKNTSTGL